jgi:hypothetical protein
MVGDRVNGSGHEKKIRPGELRGEGMDGYVFAMLPNLLWRGLEHGGEELRVSGYQRVQRDDVRRLRRQRVARHVDPLVEQRNFTRQPLRQDDDRVAIPPLAGDRGSELLRSFGPPGAVRSRPLPRELR